ncbi:hypothetical protein BT67DRAFT_415769 [Trichocladium antarcticum]|uniref:magnesium chelatase n=1 Tax=Trichocladium antarcticum TaxID=1450529 RepID=A0AAN6UU50_9PEZI|nr:hypothetical protein BT67DRAFT_415769 [Trichocladium antarcticum]
MAMAEEQEQLLDKIHTLSDLELAALLCLVAREHCLISTEPDSVDELAEELRLVSSKTFNLSSAIVSCHTHTTLDEFATGLLVSRPVHAPPSPGNTRSVSPYRPRHEQHLSPTGPASTSGSYFPISSSPRLGGPPSVGTGGSSLQASQQPRIANVILAKDLDRAPRAVQIQALELLRTRRIFTRTSVQAAPKQFLFIALVGAASGGQARVTPHLNDFFYLGHWHNPEEDGFPYLDEELGRRGGDGEVSDDDFSTTSSASVVKRHSTLGTWPTLAAAAENNHWPSHHPPSEPEPPPPPAPLLTETDISHLALRTAQTHLSVPTTRYQHNLVAFLRTHRAVVPASITPAATAHLTRLSKSLASLHGLDFATPSLVALAARKVYLHRIELVAGPEAERSMQWGSDRQAVEGLLAGVGGPEGVVEEVLGLVGVPA